MTTNTTAPANLRNAKKEQAAAKKAPAKKAAPKATTPAGRKLRWTVVEAFAKGKHQTASVDGHAYAIEQAGDGWVAKHTFRGKTVELSTGTFGKAYTACVQHNRNRA